ncbi:HEAT repeat domain-containing protein, partial [Mastigocoleus testarum]
MEEWLWNKNDDKNRIDLANYVIFAKYSEAIDTFITKAIKENYLPASSNDYHTSNDKRRELVRKIYDALCQHEIEYELNEDNLFSSEQQIIRKPEEILDTKRKGTCLDLAILFCAICWYYDLLPILILLEGHALAAVSLTHRRRFWENEKRQGEEIFSNEDGSLTDANKLWRIIKREEYLAVECTGFAKSEALEEKGFPRENGFWSFEQATELGCNQLKTNQQEHNNTQSKNLVFALNIQIAYYLWWAKSCRKRLEAEAPKTLTNNGKNLLQNIYVPLGLVERKPDAKRRPEKDAANPETGDLNKPDQEYEVVKEFQNDEFLDEVLKQRTSKKSQGKRLVIIGDPGGGKTTLLRKIADWVLEEQQGLPIWISLAKFNENLVEEKDVSDSGWLYRYLSEQWLKNLSQEGKKTPEKWQDKFEELLKNGQFWLILDGADEMAVSYPLKKIQQQLAKGWTNSIRVVLSCRLNLWEQQKDILNEKFDIYRTLDFNYPEQVHQFIDNWFGEGDEKARGLQEQLEENNRKRLQNLVKNPLRLALLCRIWNQSEGKSLPKTKADFYDSLVNIKEFSFNEWNKSKQNDKILQNLPSTDKFKQALGKLARKAIDSEDYRFLLRESFIKQRLGDPDDEPNHNSKGSLFWWALKFGWLVNVGYPTEGEENAHKSVYAFFHPTFQEYFAATAVQDYDFFLPREHKDKPVEDKQYRIFQPQWKEVILLWLGRSDVDDKEKEYLINKLINFKDECGEFYTYRAYLLAAAGIAEFTSYPRKDDISKQILKSLLLNFEQDAANLALAALEETERETGINGLLQLLSDKNLDDYTRRQAALILEKIGTDNPQAINGLVQLLSDQNLDYRDRKELVESLMKIDPDNPQAINGLVQLLSDKNLRYWEREELVKSLMKIDLNCLVQILLDQNLDYYTRWQTVESLGKIDTDNSQAINALIQLLLDKNLDYDNRLQAASILGKIIGTGNPQAINALTQLLLDKNLDYLGYCIRFEIISIQWRKFDLGNPQITNGLIQVMSDQNLHHHIRWQLASILEKIGTGNPQVINGLVQLLPDKNLDNHTRRQAVSILEKIDPDNPQFINTLIQLLSDKNLDNYTRRQAESILEKIDPDNPQFINALIQLLSNKNLDYYIRRQAASILGKIGTGNPQAINALVQLLSDKNLDGSDKQVVIFAISLLIQSGLHRLASLLLQDYHLDNDTRRQAAESLGKIDPDNPQAINALIQLLSNKNLDNDTRRQTAESLRKIDPGNLQAINALIQLLSDQNLDYYTRWQAVESLGKIDTDNPQAINAFVQPLSNKNLDYYIRWQAIESLRKIDPGNPQAINALVQLLSNKNLDYYIRREAARSLRKIDPGNLQAINGLIQLLSDKNLDNYTRCQAAESLRKIDPSNLRAINALIQLLSDKHLDYYTRREAALILGKIDPDNPQAINALIQLLSDKNLDNYTRWRAVSILRKIDPDNPQVINGLIQLLSDKNLGNYTRREAALILRKIDPSNLQAINALVQLLSDKNLDYYTRREAALILGKIGTGNLQVINGLIQLLSDKNLDHYTCRQAALILEKIGTGNLQAINGLIQLLSDKNLNYYSILRKIDPDNPQVINSLVKLLSDKNLDNYTRWRAVSILRKIDPDNP